MEPRLMVSDAAVPPGSETNSSAVERAGELDDFDAVIAQHWPRVFRFALACLRDRDAAESLAQDCFFKAYRARDRFRAGASVQTWLMQIIVNLVRDHARSRRIQFWRRSLSPMEPEAPFADRGSGAERQLLAKEKMAAVWNAVARLPERQRTVFLLRYVEELELLEIAAVTGLKEGAVKAHLFRAVHTVRKWVGR